jgi:hypothetical protein
MLRAALRGKRLAALHGKRFPSRATYWPSLPDAPTMQTLIPSSDTIGGWRAEG